MLRILVPLVAITVGCADHLTAAPPDADDEARDAPPLDAPLVDSVIAGDGAADAPADVVDAIPPSPDAPPSFQIPDALLGAGVLNGSCVTTSRGWGLDDAHRCQPIGGTTSGAAYRAVTIVAAGDGYDVSTNLHVDPLTNHPTWLYSVHLSATSPTATQSDGPGCDPIYGTCVTHDWTLDGGSLSVTTSSLHDNSSPFALPQCWEYSYARQDCTFQLTW